jgi:hypothetical protein
VSAPAKGGARALPPGRDGVVNVDRSARADLGGDGVSASRAALREWLFERESVGRPGG